MAQSERSYDIMQDKAEKLKLSCTEMLEAWEAGKRSARAKYISDRQRIDNELAVRVPRVYSCVPCAPFSVRALGGLVVALLFGQRHDASMP